MSCAFRFPQNAKKHIIVKSKNLLIILNFKLSSLSIISGSKICNIYDIKDKRGDFNRLLRIIALGKLFCNYYALNSVFTFVVNDVEEINSVFV